MTDTLFLLSSRFDVDPKAWLIVAVGVVGFFWFCLGLVGKAPKEALPMPPKVALAINLIYIQISISILSAGAFPFWGGDYYRAGAPELGLKAAGLHMFLFYVSVIGGLMGWFFTYNIGKGRNWARYFLSFMTFSGVFFVGINGLINAGFTILGLVIILFLFQKPSSDWFREMKSRSKTPPIVKDTRKYDEKGDKL